MNVLLQHERAIVIHGSCLEVCAALGPRAVGCVITDPPYTPHVHGNIRSVTNSPDGAKVREWEPGFDPLVGFEHVPALLEVAQRWVLAFCALESFGEYERAAGGQWKAGGNYVRSGIWRKKNAAPQMSGDRPANSCEGIAVMHAREGGRMHWHGRGKHAYWITEHETLVRCARCAEKIEACRCAQPAPVQVDRCVDELFVEHGRERAEKRHPAQKPEPLMSELVRLFSDEDEWILDPYCGSGSTGAAALKLGRRVILADDLHDPSGNLPPDYWARYAAERIAALLREAA